EVERERRADDAAERRAQRARDIEPELQMQCEPAQEPIRLAGDELERARADGLPKLVGVGALDLRDVAGERARKAEQIVCRLDDVEVTFDALICAARVFLRVLHPILYRQELAAL